MFKGLRLAAGFLCAGLLLLFPAAAGTRTIFPAEGEYTFYRGSASSQAQIVSCSAAYAPVYKYFFADSLTGESATYADRTAAELLEAYDAEVLFLEEVCGVVNYYCHAPALGEGAWLNGYEVNLHVAAGKGRTAVGTPLIFGGF